MIRAHIFHTGVVRAGRAILDKELNLLAAPNYDPEISEQTIDWYSP